MQHTNFETITSVISRGFFPGRLVQQFGQLFAGTFLFVKSIAIWYVLAHRTFAKNSSLQINSRRFLPARWAGLRRVQSRTSKFFGCGSEV